MILYIYFSWRGDRWSFLNYRCFDIATRNMKFLQFFLILGAWNQIPSTVPIASGFKNWKGPVSVLYLSFCTGTYYYARLWNGTADRLKMYEKIFKIHKVGYLTWIIPINGLIRSRLKVKADPNPKALETKQLKLKRCINIIWCDPITGTVYKCLFSSGTA